MFRRVATAAVACALVVLGVPNGPRFAAAAGSTTVVISEFRTRGPVGGNDEFIELFNLTTSTVSVAGWLVKGSNSTGGITVRATIPAGATIPPCGHFLLTNNNASLSYSGTVAGDARYGVGIGDDGGIALTMPDGVIVDQVGMSVGSAFKEGTPLPNFGVTNADRAYARKGGGAQDTNDNTADFLMVSPSGPQNLLSAPTCVADAAPTVVSTTPANGDTNVPVTSNISVGFSEPVTLADGWFTITCPSGVHTAIPSSGGPNVYLLDPVTDFGSDETCTVTVDASKVSDTDGLPPANMDRNYSFSFTTAPLTDIAPSVVFINPLNGATSVARDATVTIGFSEPVILGADWYLISCAVSGVHAAAQSIGGPAPNVYALDPAVDFAASEACTVTVDATKVSDTDGLPPSNMAANFVFSFTTAANVCLDPATAIHAVQGGGLLSPMAGATVTVQGVVVGDYQQTPAQYGGFYLEEEDADRDADPATSEGIFIFSTTSVSAGDIVRVTGTVKELASGTSSLTEIAPVTAVTLCATGAAVTVTEITLPVASMSDFERYEGMLVHFTQTLTATETFTLGRFGEVRLAADGRLYTPTAVVAPGASAIAKEDENQRRSFVLDDGNNQPNIDPTINPAGGLSASNTLRSGYTVTGLTGIFDQRFSSYRLQPFAGVAFAPSNPRTSAPTGTDNLKIASFNVLNFFNGNGLGGGFPTARGANTSFEYARQKAKEVSALQQMDADVVGLMEMENDAPPYSAIEDLVAGLNLVMGAGTYSFINTGVIGTDAIKVALIYKPAKVTPIGAYAILTTAVDPRFVDTKNRPSLAQTFRSTNGATLTVVVNHLKSKGSDCNDLGDRDMGDGQGNCNVTRRNAAAALVDWLATDPTGSHDPDFLLIGDMNSYTFEDPITTFTGHGFTNLVRQYGGLEAYSYVFGGESGYLDHGLATSSLAAQVTKATDWHINSDEPTVLDYNTEFKTANQVNTFYDAGPYRASDHDPVLVFLQLVDDTPPTISGATTSTPNADGWYSSAVTVHFTCADNVAVVFCEPDHTLSGDGLGQSVTGFAADAAGNRASATVGDINIDRTPPIIVLSGPLSYTADQTLAITCTASDALSGVVVASCPGLSGPALAVGLGTHTFTSGATDRAGNVGTATVTYTVSVTYTSLCTLTRAYTTGAGIANSLCKKLDAAGAARGSNATNIIDAYIHEVEAQRGKAIDTTDAGVLIALARAL